MLFDPKRKFEINKAFSESFRGREFDIATTIETAISLALADNILPSDAEANAGGGGDFFADGSVPMTGNLIVGDVQPIIPNPFNGRYTLVGSQNEMSGSLVQAYDGSNPVVEAMLGCWAGTGTHAAWVGSNSNHPFVLAANFLNKVYINPNNKHQIYGDSSGDFNPRPQQDAALTMFVNSGGTNEFLIGMNESDVRQFTILKRGWGRFGDDAASFGDDDQTLVAFGRSDSGFSLISGWNGNDSFWTGVNPNDAGSYDSGNFGGPNQGAIVFGTFNENGFEHPPVRFSIGVGENQASIFSDKILLNRKTEIIGLLAVGDTLANRPAGTDIWLKADTADGGVTVSTSIAGNWLSRFVHQGGPDFIRFGHDIGNDGDNVAVIKSDGSLLIGKSTVSYGFIGEYVAVSSTAPETAFLARSEGEETVEMMMTAAGGPGAFTKGGYLGTFTDHPVTIFSGNNNVAQFDASGVKLAGVTTNPLATFAGANGNLQAGSNDSASHFISVGNESARASLYFEYGGAWPSGLVSLIGSPGTALALGTNIADDFSNGHYTFEMSADGGVWIGAGAFPALDNLYGHEPSVVSLKVKGAVGQTADIMQVVSDTNAVLASVDKDGVLDAVGFKVSGTAGIDHTEVINGKTFTWTKGILTSVVV